MSSDKKGFRGLDGLVSDISEDLAPQSETQLANSDTPVHPQPSPVVQSESSPELALAEPVEPGSSGTEYESEVSQAPAQPTRASSAGMWLLGIGAVVAFLWLVSQSGNKSAPLPDSVAPHSSAPAPASPPSRPTEEEPPPGNNNVLSPAQIRYCLAEAIRLNSAGNAMASQTDSDVGTFNEMVTNYNSRCGVFQYQSGMLEIAKADIEPYRSIIQDEGWTQAIRPSTAAAQRTEGTSRQQARNGESPASPGAEPWPNILTDSSASSAVVPFEQSPPIGTGQILSDAQIKYCLAQAIRLDIMRTLLNRLQAAEVEALNRLMADYNLRCGNYLYCGTAEESEKAAAQANRIQIEDEARNYWHSVATLPSIPTVLPPTAGSSSLREARLPVPMMVPVHQAHATMASCPAPATDKTEPFAAPGIAPVPSQLEAPESSHVQRQQQVATTPPPAVPELAPSLVINGGNKPELSSANKWEQEAIEYACTFHDGHRDQTDYNNCLQTQLSGLSSYYLAKPNLSRLYPSELASMNQFCKRALKERGPRDYYDCLSHEKNNLGRR